MAPKQKYVFHVVDVDAVRQEREAERLHVASGAYSNETYKERLTSNRGPVATPDEIHRAQLFNRKWRLHCRRHTAENPGKACYWCLTLKPRSGESVLSTRTPDRASERTIRRQGSEEKNAIFL